MGRSSFPYVEPWLVAAEPRVCLRCKQTIKPGDMVHWWDGVLWHTMPCPG